MHHRHRRRDPAPPRRYQLCHPFARIALGSTVAIAVLSAGILVFLPFSDLSVQELAAGPHAKGPGKSPAEAHQAASESAPIARLARRDTRGP